MDRELLNGIYQLIGCGITTYLAGTFAGYKVAKENLVVESALAENTEKALSNYNSSRERDRSYFGKCLFGLGEYIAIKRLKSGKFNKNILNVRTQIDEGLARVIARGDKEKVFTLRVSLGHTLTFGPLEKKG